MLQVFGGLTHTCSHPPTSPMATKASILVLVMINGGIRGSALISPSLVLSPSIHHALVKILLSLAISLSKLAPDVDGTHLRSLCCVI